VVVRPTAGDIVVDELVVMIVGEGQSVGKSQRKGAKPGDAVLVQTADTFGAQSPSTNTDGLRGLFAEVTFHAPPPGETRTTFNAMIERVSFLGLVDIRDVEVVLYADQVRRSRMTLLPAHIKQLKVNGHLFVMDAPKRSLVVAAIRDYRETLRAEEARRERLRLAEIASAERIRIAEAQAMVAAAQSRERVRLAELASAERVELARLSVERANADARAKEEERMRIEALVALARADAARRQAARRGPTEPPFPASMPSGWDFIDSPSGNGGPVRGTGGWNGPTMEDAKKAWNIATATNGVYGGLRRLGVLPASRLDEVSDAISTIDSGVELGKAIMSLF
jgi:hypothetical protein